MIRIAPSIFEMLPIESVEGLCEAIGRDRSQLLQLRQAETLQAVRRIIDLHFEKAQGLFNEMSRGFVHPERQIQLSAELYHLWGFVDGLIYGKTEGVLPDQVSGLRKEWTDRCDSAFGGKVGEVLGLHR